VHLEASTKPHVHKKIHEFLMDMAFTMAYPNFKKGLKMAFGPLGVKRKVSKSIPLEHSTLHGVPIQETLWWLHIPYRKMNEQFF
jgi:hypothetical protein